MYDRNYKIVPDTVSPRIINDSTREEISISHIVDMWIGNSSLLSTNYDYNNGHTYCLLMSSIIIGSKRIEFL